MDRSGCGQVRAWAVVSASIRLARCASVIALAAFARIPFATRVSGPLPSRAQVTYELSSVSISCSLPSRAQVAFVASGALAARLPPSPSKCAENGDIDTPGHVAFDKLHFIL